MNFELCLGALFLLVSVASSYEREYKIQKIVGGEAVTTGQYPWFTTPLAICGGALIHKDIVLTAAHCVMDYFSSTYVDLYSCTEVYTNISVSPYCLNDCSFTGEEVNNTITDLIVHENFDFNYDLENDIALLKLATPVPDSISPVSYNTDDNIPEVGDTLRVIGIGTTSSGGVQSDELLYADKTAVDQGQCNEEWDFISSITSDKMCAKEQGKDSCQGDSGGPLFIDGDTQKLVGIVSYGIGCADDTQPSPVYTRVSHFASFIEQSICCLSSDPPTSCTNTNCPSEAARGTCGEGFHIREPRYPYYWEPSPPASCFSLMTYVWLKDGGIKYMKDVEVGDMVLTASGEYEMVYTIDHLVEGKATTMVKLYLDDDKEPALELTPSHMVYSSSNIDNPIPAKMVKTGNFLQTISGSKEVTKIEMSNDSNIDGYINILTIDGTIVVGSKGIVASNYADHLGIGIDDTHDLFHIVTKPLKFFCTQISGVTCELPAKATDHERIIVHAQLGRKLLNILDPFVIILTASFLRQSYLLKYIFWSCFISIFVGCVGCIFTRPCKNIKKYI